jgi:uncharacterized protein (DUF1501 family)
MKTRHYDRRQFLKLSAASLSALGLAGTPLFLRRALAGPLAPGKKLLFIFLRGGMDAVQFVIPYGDQGIPAKGIPNYLGARPTLGVDPATAHDLNGFASLFPTAQEDTAAGPRLADIFHGGVDERGPNLALIHRAGYETQNRSHFSSQQFYENGVPGAVSLEEGVFNRYITAYRDAENPMQGATVETNQVVLMKGETLLPVLASIDAYALPGNVSIGVRPSAGSPLGSGLLGAYGQSGFHPTRPYEAFTYATGVTLLENLEFFEKNVRNTPYTPEPDAVPYYDAIADRNFREHVRDCARLLKQVDSLQIVGCNQNGYDTHGSENLRFPTLVRDFSLAMTALYHDLKPIWPQTVVLCMTEFGRTPIENANRGTDHGEACVMVAMGGPVNGGVYNCDASTWANGDLLSTANGRYLAHRTDYRAVYHEVLTRHLGDPLGRIDTIIPGYSGLVASDTSGYFTPLNFIA